MAKADKLDLFREHKEEYLLAKKPALVKTTIACYLAIDGKGSPGGQAFQDAVGALYGAAYTIKMTRKFAGEQDYKVCTLEALYWQDGGCCLDLPKEEWRWKMMVRTPSFIKPKDLKNAVAALLEKDKGALVRQVRLEKLSEGLCVQMLHVGPYDEAARTVAEMRAFCESRNLKPVGRHHEIYLSDPHRVAPEKLRTLFRQPVQ